VHLGDRDFRDVMVQGARWCIAHGYG
jgi:hypothetical protein